MSTDISINFPQFIIDNCLTKKGGLNNRVCSKSWWVNKNLTYIYDQIIESTGYLPEKSSFSQRLWHLVNGDDYPILCNQCQQEKVNFLNFSKGYREYCSVYCVTQNEERNQKISTKIIEKYPETAEKMKKTFLERYGSEHYFSSDEGKQKAISGKIEKYGTLFVNREKAKQTCLERFGSEYFFTSEEFLNRDNKHGLNFFDNEEDFEKSHDPDWLRKQNETKGLPQIADELNIAYRTIYLRFKEFDIPIVTHFNRHMENEIFEFLTSVHPSWSRNDRSIISPKELDFYNPDHKIAIELNGVYWHSVGANETKKDVFRHQNKKFKCMEQGIDLITITDFDWVEKRHIVESMIKNRLGLSKKIYARKLEVDTSPDKKAVRDFIEANHIQGTCPFSKAITLNDDNGIVAVLTYGPSRFVNNHTEILRYCVASGTNVIGGFSRLLSRIPKDNIVSYCNLDFFNGNLYEKTGFELSHVSRPSYFYYNNGTRGRVSRYSAQKHKLPKLLEGGFNEQISESENMFRNGYTRYWNCGTKVFKIRA